MAGYIKKRSKKTGLPPGSLVYIGKEWAEKARITIIDYDEMQYQEKKVKTIEECFPIKDKPTITWINIDGLHELEIIEKIGKHFRINLLLLEDIANTEQRPKMEDFGDHLFVVLKMFYYDEKEDEIKSEQVSIILGSNFVISFKETEKDIFKPVKQRIRIEKSRIRKTGADYLAYALIDTIVDNYFIILEILGEKIEFLEDELVTEPNQKTLQEIHKLKKQMIFLRKSAWPLREVVSGLERLDSPLIHGSTGIYLRDVYDHTIQVIDTIETFRDMLAGILDIYLSSISNKMNEIMKILTIIATIFIPLTFITGIYGMNFKYIPELDWRWGYPAALLAMGIIGIVMIVYFRRKKWL